MKEIVKGRIVSNLELLKKFTENGDKYAKKAQEAYVLLKKNVTAKEAAGEELNHVDFKDELTTLEKTFFLDSLLLQNTVKLAAQTAELYTVVKLSKFDLELSEEEIKALEKFSAEDFNLFTVDKGEITTVEHSYVKPIMETIESRDAETLDKKFKQILADPSFKDLQV